MITRSEALAAVMDAEEYQLDRQATALKRAGDWAGAIAALRRRKALLGEGWADDKLAKYLQQAGQFEEALQEIEWLVANSHAWAQGMFGHQPATVRQRQRAGFVSRVLEAGVLICKRAKRSAEQAAYQARADQYRRIVNQIEPLAAAASSQRLQALRQRPIA
ncbi:hypothetical protein HNQ51_001743 [Inhella inkyongensis]|uniref:Tetratricopeptide repeat protein n=1 Tax=Inhella inkyongensis TaxID=392593 RepID=A0A840S7K9_9BURK|nr:hypothetical protein [Inhella inkyongensis]MBB5204429.1 hypothetical protein [Inhella inkyongensis]